MLVVLEKIYAHTAKQDFGVSSVRMTVQLTVLVVIAKETALIVSASISNLSRVIT